MFKVCDIEVIQYIELLSKLKCDFEFGLQKSGFFPF